MDHSADGLMKNVASYDNRCELQNTPSTLSFERTLRPQHLLWPRLSECRIIISNIVMLSTCWSYVIFFFFTSVSSRRIGMRLAALEAKSELSGTLRTLLFLATCYLMHRDCQDRTHTATLLCRWLDSDSSLSGQKRLINKHCKDRRHVRRNATD